MKKGVEKAYDRRHPIWACLKSKVGKGWSDTGLVIKFSYSAGRVPPSLFRTLSEVQIVNASHISLVLGSGQHSDIILHVARLTLFSIGCACLDE